MKLLSPFHAKHVEAGASFFSYCGWQLPEVYTSEEEELRCVREGVGFTEYPFMSHVAVAGPEAEAVLDKAASCDLSLLAPGRARYCLMLKDTGEIAEDVIVFRIAEDLFLVNGRVKVNPTRPYIEDLFTMKGPKAWLEAQAAGRSVALHEVGLTLFTVQGPRSREVLGQAADLAELDYFGLKVATVGDIPALIARMGFSGELGYEILVWPESAIDLWELVEHLGRADGIRPYGINVTKILGLEKGYLGGADFYPGATPYELGLDWAVSRDKPAFVGKAACGLRRAAGIQTKLVGLEARTLRAAPAKGDRLQAGNEPVGEITGSAYSPTFRKTLARGWVRANFARPGCLLQVSTANETAPVEVTESYRWYDPKGDRLKA